MPTLMNNKDLEPFDAFLAQLDSKVGIEEIIRSYPSAIEAFGKHLLKGTDQWFCSTLNENSEFIDFIDGNGFYVEPLPHKNRGSLYSIHPLIKKETI